MLSYPIAPGPKPGRSFANSWRPDAKIIEIAKGSSSVDRPVAKFKVRSAPGEVAVVTFSDGGSAPPASTKNDMRKLNKDKDWEVPENGAFFSVKVGVISSIEKTIFSPREKLGSIKPGRDKCYFC